MLDALAECYDRLVLKRDAMIGIAHADNEEGTAYLLKKLREKGFTGQELTVCYEPVTGAHVGPRLQWHCSSSAAAGRSCCKALNPKSKGAPV